MFSVPLDAFHVHTDMLIGIRGPQTGGTIGSSQLTSWQLRTWQEVVRIYIGKVEPIEPDGQGNVGEEILA